MKRLFVFVLMVGLMSSLVEGSTQLSFDTLFPETAHKQLHDTVLQLWSDLTLLHGDHVSDIHKRELYDMINGQIMRINHLIEHMQTKGNAINYADIAYVDSIAQGLSKKFNDFLAQEHIQPHWHTILSGFDLLLTGD